MLTKRPARSPGRGNSTGSRSYLRTFLVANAIGVHPNAIRKYEAWRFLPRIPRTPSGYRTFTEEHLEQVILVRLALAGVYPGGRQLMVDVVQLAAAGDHGD